jgi:hypothetical protein
MPVVSRLARMYAVIHTASFFDVGRFTWGITQLDRVQFGIRSHDLTVSSGKKRWCSCTHSGSPALSPVITHRAHCAAHRVWHPDASPFRSSRITARSQPRGPGVELTVMPPISRSWSCSPQQPRQRCWWTRWGNAACVNVCVHRHGLSADHSWRRGRLSAPRGRDHVKGLAQTGTSLA